MSTDASPERARESRRSGPLVGAVRWMENLSDTAYAYVLLIPVFLLLGAIALYPLLRTFELSLFETSLNQATQEFVGLSNYVEFCSPAGRTAGSRGPRRSCRRT